MQETGKFASRPSSQDVRASFSDGQPADFDTSKMWFHGTTSPKNFKAFRPGAGGVNELGRGIYFTSDPGVAQAWAGRPGDGGRIIPVFLRKGEIFDLFDPVDHLALARRIMARHEVTPDERLARIIRERKDVMSWTADEQSLINRCSEQLWRTWLMEPVEDFARWLKSSTRAGDHLNAWLERAGYIGAVHSRSQIAGQIVVFRASDIKSPWEKGWQKMAPAPLERCEDEDRQAGFDIASERPRGG